MKLKNIVFVGLIVISILLLIYVFSLKHQLSVLRSTERNFQTYSLDTMKIPPGTPVNTDNGGANLPLTQNTSQQGNKAILMVKEITGYPVQLFVDNVYKAVIQSYGYWCDIYNYLDPFPSINVRVEKIDPNDPNPNPEDLHAKGYLMRVIKLVENVRLPDNVGNMIYNTTFPTVTNDREYFIDIENPGGTEIQMGESFGSLSSPPLKFRTNRFVLWHSVSQNTPTINYTLTLISGNNVTVSIYYFE